MDRGAWQATVHGGHKESDMTVATWHASTIRKDNNRNRDMDENSSQSLKDRLQETMGAGSRVSSYLAHVFCGLSAKEPRTAIRRHTLLWCTWSSHPATSKEVSQRQGHKPRQSQRNEPRTWKHQDPSTQAAPGARPTFTISPCVT